MLTVVFLGLSHWHVPMHVLAARRAGMAVLGGFDEDPTLRADWAAREAAIGFSSIEAALDAAPGLVVVTGTPFDMPARLAAAVERGVPVLVEKPVAANSAALAPLAAFASRQRAFVAVALPHRQGPAARTDVGKIVRHVSFRLVNGPPQRYRSWNAGWVLDPATGGGGALRNLGLHGLDLAHRLLGDGLVVTGATLRRWHGEAVEDHAVVHLAVPSGGTATVEAGYLHPADTGSDFEVRVIGSEAIVVETGDDLRFTSADGVVKRLAPLALDRRYDVLMADLRDRLLDGRPPAATLGDLAAAMALADEAYRQAGLA